MAQTLHSLIKAIGLEVPLGLPNPSIEKITCDSRCVEKRTLFIGLPGEKTDGGCFWANAIQAGAVAAIVGQLAAKNNPPGKNDAVVVVPEPLGKWAGELIAAFWGRPSSEISLIGVTGTNGKTTTTHLIDYLSEAVGMKSALFGTLYNRWPLHQEISTYTTNFAEVLQKQLSQAVNAGSEIAAMEVSSHSLVQHRVAGCLFSGAVFTNLTQDHLDYHSSMEEYFNAKTLLFKEPLLKEGDGRAIVNIDDKWGYELSRQLKTKCWRCSLDINLKNEHNAELFIDDLQVKEGMIQGRLHSPAGEGLFKSPLIGHPIAFS